MAPLDGKSSGLIVPGQSFHELISVKALIVSTPFWMNCLCFLCTVFIQDRGSNNSDQKKTFLIAVNALRDFNILILWQRIRLIKHMIIPQDAVSKLA